MKLTTAIDFQQGRVVANDLVKNDNGQVTILAFDEGAVLAKHKAPGDAMVQVIEGDVTFVVEGQKNDLTAGDYLTMSVGTEHEVYASSKAKVVLTIIKTDACDCGCGCDEKKQVEIDGFLPEN